MGIFLFVDVERVSKEIEKNRCSTTALQRRIKVFEESNDITIFPDTANLKLNSEPVMEVEELDEDHLPGTLESDYARSWDTCDATGRCRLVAGELQEAREPRKQQFFTTALQ